MLGWEFHGSARTEEEERQEEKIARAHFFLVARMQFANLRWRTFFPLFILYYKME